MPSRTLFSSQTKMRAVLTMFSILIILDVIGLFDSLISLASSWLESPKPDTSSQEERFQHIAFFIGEMFCFGILLLCNSLGITAIQKKTPYLLVPWLGTYMVGILSCYIASFIFFLSQFYDNSLTLAPLVPAVTGLVFHSGWSLVKNIYNDLRIESRLG